MRHNQWNLSSKIVSSMEIWHMSICPCKQINNKWNLSSKTVSSMEIWHMCTCPCKQETTNRTCNQSQSAPWKFDSYVCVHLEMRKKWNLSSNTFSYMKIWHMGMCPCGYEKQSMELVLKDCQVHERYRVVIRYSSIQKKRRNIYIGMRETWDTISAVKERWVWLSEWVKMTTTLVQNHRLQHILIS